MRRLDPFRIFAVAVIVLVTSALLLPSAGAVVGKRIRVTKSDENFQGHAGVTFKLYQDNPPQAFSRCGRNLRLREP